MGKLRLGIIGVGNIGTGHAENILAGLCPELEITAAADRRESRRAWIRENLPGIPVFTEGEELIASGTIREIRPSSVWYRERESFAPDQAGRQLPALPDRGFELLQGAPVFSGKILGGCIDSLYDFFNGDRYVDMPVLCRKYHLFPDAEDWKGRIQLLESSEEKPTPENYRDTLEYLKGTGVFSAVSGVLAGKPMDETYAEEYKRLLVEVIGRPELPIVFNLNIGHAMPRCIMPFGVDATVDAEKQVIRFAE